MKLYFKNSNKTSHLIIAVLTALSLLLVSCGENSESSELSEASTIGDITSENSSTESKEDIPPEKPDFPEWETSETESGTEGTENAEPLTYSISYKDSDLETSFDENTATAITLKSSTADINGSGAEFSEGTLTISSGGTYVLRGELSGRIIVDSADTKNVRLILAGVSVTCTKSSPLYVKSADKVILTLVENTVNTFKDGADFVYDDTANEEPSATIFSKDDLTINGKGSLEVEAVFKNGIQCKDKLKICGGNINVTSQNDGIKGKDCVGICGGTITVNSKGDGIQSSNTDAGNVGFVNVSDGNVKITSSLDGIQGENGVCISGGVISITSGKNSSSSDTDSKKGIKGTNDVTVTGGKINVTSTDDGIHSDGNINIEGGEITVSSGDDGFHAENNVNIKNGTVTITRSYEGLEGLKINISGGTTRVTASDDGVNASSGSGGGTGGFHGGGGGMMADSNCQFNVSGGYIYVNAQGDGLDSNGNMSISGGTVICEGPTNGGNSAIDHNGSIVITGGTLLSLGSSGMAGEALSSTTGTTQSVFGTYCNGSAGTTIAIKQSDGTILCVFKASKQFGHIVYSSPLLKTGETYEILSGGNGSRDSTDGLYQNNSYSGGSVIATITQSATVTGGGGGMGGFPGGGGNSGFPGGGGSTRPQKPNRW